MNCCENCGWSETYRSIIMCRYTGHRTWRDECCEAWKSKEQETQPQIVRCKDCKHYRFYGLSNETVSECLMDHCENPAEDWYCADGETE